MCVFMKGNIEGILGILIDIVLGIVMCMNILLFDKLRRGNIFLT